MTKSLKNEAGGSSKAGKRLGTWQRNQLVEAYESRGTHRSNLWMVYSPKAQADFVLRSDIEFGHFLLAESDPDIEAVDYAPAKRVGEYAGEGLATAVDADLRLRSGTVIWREIKHSDEVASGAQTRANLQLLIQAKLAAELNVRHEVLTEVQIFENPQRILNWMRIIPWISQAREWPLLEYISVITRLLKARQCIELREIHELADGQNNALYIAALFRGVQLGRFGSDVNEMTLSDFSRFYLPGRPQ